MHVFSVVESSQILHPIHIYDSLTDIDAEGPGFRSFFFCPTFRIFSAGSKKSAIFLMDVSGKGAICLSCRERDGDVKGFGVCKKRVSAFKRWFGICGQCIVWQIPDYLLKVRP